MGGLETGRRPLASSECYQRYRGRATHHCTATLLSCGLPASRRHPSGLEPHGFGCSRLVVATPPRGLRTGGTGSIRTGDLPQAWVPLQSMTRSLRADLCQRHHSPEVFRPQRHPSAEIHHSRILPFRVTLRPRTYHVPRRLAPSTDSLVSFQPGALSGRILQSLT